VRRIALCTKGAATIIFCLSGRDFRLPDGADLGDL